MKFDLNGEPVEVAIDPHGSAVELIRATGRTGTKLVCGAGVCGACTVLVDGVPKTSCLIPVHQLAGKSVHTIEAHPPSNLHPVQKAFMAADALQCGFCTPGFVMDAIAFYERWKTHHLSTAPSRAEIAEALSGHLCRCGAYPGVYEAVARACAGEFEESGRVFPPRVDALEKVTGTARFTVDVQHEGQVLGRLVRSTLAHAEIRAVDLAPALEHDGVVAAVDLLDPEDRFVRYVGQPIAAVAAETDAALKEALRLVRVDYEPLPFAVDPVAAERGDGPVYRANRKKAPNTSEGPVPPARWDGNVRRMLGDGMASTRARKARRLIARADGDPALERVHATFTTADQIHTALEPHAAVARWDGNDALTVHVSTQTVDQVCRELAEHYGIPQSKVTVIAEFVGGAFGAKQGAQIEVLAAAELARAARAPVLVMNDRLEEMTTGGHRPASRVEVDLVATTEGRLQAMRVAGTGFGGTGVNSTIALFARLVYPGIPKLLNDRDVVSNLPPGKPFRGPFGAPFFWAIESAVDEMAHGLDLDPLEVRRRSDPHARRRALYEWASELEVWRTRGAVGADSGRFRRGVGVSMGAWFSAYYAGTEVEVSTTPEGIRATTGSQDMGNGTRSVIATAVAEVFRLDPNQVLVEIGRSGPFRGPTSSGSRTTNAVYTPSREAALRVRAQLIALATRRLGVKNPAVGQGGLDHDAGFIPWLELTDRLPPVRAVAKRGSNGPMDLLGKLPSGSLAMNLASGTTAAVYVCELVVDTRLGRVEPRAVWGGIAAGRIICPEVARSQIHGAIIQGIGYALFEERHVDPTTGTVLSLGLEEYRIPGLAEMPGVEIHFHEEGFEHIKGGASGLSELATVPIAAAVGNAVFHATGARFHDLPIRPDRVLAGLGA